MEQFDMKKMTEELHNAFSGEEAGKRPLVVGITGEKEKFRLVKEGKLKVDRVVMKPVSKRSLESALNIC